MIGSLMYYEPVSVAGDNL